MKPGRAIATVALAAAAVVAADAQTNRGVSGPVNSRSGVERYTASVQGVVTADSGAPVQGAEVRLLGSGRHRLAMTDAAGRFVFTDVPPEVMRLHASKAGFVDTQYGPFALAPGQQETAALALGRGGVIYGHVFDEYGEPAAGALVEALLTSPDRGQRTLRKVGGSDLADDTGAFRLYGLPPGSFVVSARPGPAGRAKRGAATYYPGTPSMAYALPVAVESGSQVPVSIVLGAVPLARVSGVLVNATGTPTSGYVTLLPEVRITPRGADDRVSVALDATRLSSTAGLDGRFTIADVPPGSYMLNATVIPDQRPEALRELAQLAALSNRQTQETASQPVVVSGQDISGLTLVTRPLSP